MASSSIPIIRIIIQICPVALNVANNLPAGQIIRHLADAGGQMFAVILPRYEGRCRRSITWQSYWADWDNPKFYGDSIKIAA